MSSPKNNQVTQNDSLKPNQPTLLANQEKVALSTLKIDPVLYKFPKVRSDKFQIADNLVVHQNDTQVNHKVYGGMIIHEKPEIQFYPTKAMVFQQRNGIENQERKHEIGKQAIEAYSTGKTLKPFDLKPENEHPRYATLSRFDADLSFVSTSTLGENIRFNCSRFDDGGWVFDTVRMQELHELVEQEYSLDEKIEIDDVKQFFGNLRLLKFIKFQESTSKASEIELPKSSSSKSKASNVSLPRSEPDEYDEILQIENADYNLEHSLMNNGEFQAEIRKIEEDTRNRESDYQHKIKNLENKITKKDNEYRNLCSKVKKISQFVNSDKLMNERETFVNIHLNEKILDTIDFDKPIPMRVPRVRIERIIDLVDNAMWLIPSDNDTEDEEPKFNSLSVNASSDSDNNMVETSTKIKKDNYVQKRQQPGTRTSPALFRQVFADNFPKWRDAEWYTPKNTDNKTKTADPGFQSNIEQLSDEDTV